MPSLRVNAARAGIGADPVDPSEKTAVTVRLLDIYTAHRTVLSQATAIAAKMFSSAGVRIEWRYQYSSRRQSRLDGDPVVRMRSHTPVTYLPTALASALPYQGSEITVFYDRVEQEIGPHFRAVLLAHVLVHEITHLLEGVSRHSATGIMKASWTADDKWTMIRKPMSFAPEDLALIRLGLASRTGTGRLLPGAKTAVPRPNHFGTSCVQCRY
jgi:hypothetical protein